MVDALLDTSIIVDFLREYPPAANWLATSTESFGITKFVWLEVIEGATSKLRQKEAIELLNKFVLVPVELSDIDWALSTLTTKVLANNGLDMKDALIASTSARLQVPLYTRNLKHMRSFLDALAQAPY